MKLEKIATLSGKGGLYNVLKPSKSGVILESLDQHRTKLVATPQHKMSVLSEISIYTTSKEGTVSLESVLKKIHNEFGNDIGIDAAADASELKAFLKAVLPDYDEARVYVSDIKKLVKWYGILTTYAPELFTEKQEETSQP
jgi:hypothetical protein